MRKTAAFLISMTAAAATAFTGCTRESLFADDSGAYDEAMYAFEAEDYDKAIELFEKAVNTDGRAAEGYRGEGLVYFARGSYKFATNFFDMSLDALAVDNPEFERDVKYYKAESLKKSGRKRDASQLYEELALLPGGNLANAALGQMSLEDGDTKEAMQYFDLAVTDCTDYEVYLLIYTACSDALLEADGTAYLEKALEIEPQTNEDMADLGRGYYSLEEVTKAMEYLNRAVDGGYIDAVPVLGNIYLEENNIAAARALYEKAQGLGLAEAECYNGFALCSLAEGKPDIALQYIEEGLKVSGETEARSLLFNEVAAYEAKRDFDTARDKAAAFLEIYPNDKSMIREYKFLSRNRY